MRGRGMLQESNKHEKESKEEIKRQTPGPSGGKGEGEQSRLEGLYTQDTCRCPTTCILTRSSLLTPK